MRPQEEAEGGAPMEQETVLELFDRYADMVYRIALSYLRSPQEAEDVVQTVFLKLLEGGMIVYPGKERAFLTKVTIRFLYKGIIIKHNKTEPTYTKTSLFLCEKRCFLWPGLRKEGNLFKLAGPGGLAFFHLTKKEVSKWPMKK